MTHEVNNTNTATSSESSASYETDTPFASPIYKSRVIEALGNNPSEEAFEDFFGDALIFSNNDDPSKAAEEVLNRLESEGRVIARVEIVSGGASAGASGVTLFDNKGIAIAHYEGKYLGYEGSGPLDTMKFLQLLGADYRTIDDAEFRAAKDIDTPIVLSREKREKIDGEYYPIRTLEEVGPEWRVEKPPRKSAGQLGRTAVNWLLERE